jgi:hypothetical protein
MVKRPLTLVGFALKAESVDPLKSFFASHCIIRTGKATVSMLIFSVS